MSKTHFNMNSDPRLATKLGDARRGKCSRQEFYQQGARLYLEAIEMAQNGFKLFYRDSNGRVLESEVRLSCL